MTEARPHRAALPADAPRRSVRAEARAGRLDRDAVEAVLAAAGRRRRRPAHAPGRPYRSRAGGRSRLLARGLTNKEIATALDISVKTAGHHVQHIFEKAGVTTRAAATLFAMQNDLIALDVRR